VPVRPAQLIDIGATLGADVPFFLSGGTALGLGRGEEIYPLADLPRHWVVLLIPGFGVSTSEAYAWYDAERELGRGAPVREAQHVPGPWPSRAAQMINDLEAPIARHHPEIDQMKAALRRSGAAAAAMSGSGSAVFGLFQKRSEAVHATDLLRRSWRVILTESLGRGEYERRSRPQRGGKSGGKHGGKSGAKERHRVARNPLSRLH
jgi:4-diphosphocytidyl-2-C-methyl-D-erythritol kinase